MDEYFCPNCGSTLNNQYGFDPDNGSWDCSECGKTLYGDNVYDGDTYPGTMWYCDNCGVLMNKQSGFADYYSSWTCTKCWNENDISIDRIYESKGDYQTQKYESNWDCEDGDEDDNDDGCDVDDDEDDEDYDVDVDYDVVKGKQSTRGSYPTANRSSIQRRCAGVLIYMIMIAVGTSLSILAFKIMTSGRFKWAIFLLSSGLIILLGGRLFRKAAFEINRLLLGIIANIAMKIGGIFLIFNHFGTSSGFSGVLLSIGMGIALTIGGRFVQKEIEKE